MNYQLLERTLACANDPDSLHSGSELFKPQLRGNRRVRKGMLGLSNLGNTCFMNAALQCLTHTHGLQKYFRRCSYVYKSKSDSSRQKLVSSFGTWFERDWGENIYAPYPHHTPDDILRSVQGVNPMFQGCAQHDSQEFLRCVLDCMHEELARQIPEDLQSHLKTSYGIKSCGVTAASSSSTLSERTPEVGENQSWDSSADARQSTPDQNPENTVDDVEAQCCRNRQKTDRTDGEVRTSSTSIISDLFQGRAISIVRCMQCLRKSETEEMMQDVSVPLPSQNELDQSMVGQRGSGSSWMGMFSGIAGKVKGLFYDKGVDITDCIRKYCGVEYLSGKDKYFCEHCKRKHDCEKWIVFKELPEVLCIHIKRFRYNGCFNGGTKNSKTVTFPVDKPIDLSEFLQGSPAPTALYKLIGLIQHIGSLSSGHYIAYCLHRKSPQKWYEFDDTHVSEVNVDHVERAEPYVLFFQRMASREKRLERKVFKEDLRRARTHLEKCLQQQDHSDPSMGSVIYQNLAIHTALVSKHWYVRLTTMSQPGPVDNHKYICRHNLLGYNSEYTAIEPFVRISRGLWEDLVKKYGGGPDISGLGACSKCRQHLAAYNIRRKAEHETVIQYDTQDTGDGKYWYLVDNAWVQKWREYVGAKPATITDIKDASPPGKVTNSALFDKDHPDIPRPNLRNKVDFIGVNADIWSLFSHTHGGGPVICRKELDIWSEAGEPEMRDVTKFSKIMNEEMAMQISNEFVDEFHGNMEAYLKKYPAKYNAFKAATSLGADKITLRSQFAAEEHEVSDADSV